MGLFVSEDGQYQGWLAALLCCCAAVNEDEAPIERGRSRPSTRQGNEVCTSQPLPLATLPPYTQHGSPISLPEWKDDKVMADDDTQRPKTPSPVRHHPSKPSLLARKELSDRRSSHSRERKSAHGSRPSTSASSGFRRLESAEAKRSSLVPLKLGPVKLSPAVEASGTPGSASSPRVGWRNQRSESTKELLGDPPRLAKESPFQRCQRRSSSVPAVRSYDSTGLIAMPASFDNKAQFAQRPPPLRQTSSDSIHHQAQQGKESSVKPRPSSDSTRVKQKQSNQSLRRNLPANAETEVDREILELNTIIEERRADKSRHKKFENHIPAVAPSMQVRARSETLNSIGSAFSRPATARQQPARIWTDFDPPANVSRKPSFKRSPSQTSSRVSGWLSGLMGSTPTQSPTQEPFYKCRPPAGVVPSAAHSRTSLCSSLTDIDSPSLTVATTPTTKGHNRSVTADSRTTPSSPATTYGQSDIDKRKERENWPNASSATDQVGIAF
ncbi:hypothetical protein K431DRAFT_114619 [Polychaeton citri CBS 116435]|uniref:Uncharacterized protein n=1 Tax=Polychaeton citri CBS 116435 TaxID=1314669 RepID=A0A9P4Q2E4_9PEZI|nr:hypothetical protein K431DRAFT_114619 [Polychaeton citri CBS 116435]